MVEYYKTTGGYFYKKKKNGEIERVAKKVYMKNLMKGGAGSADGGGGGISNEDIITMMNKLNWSEYHILISKNSNMKGLKSVDLYKNYRNTKLPNIMNRSMEDIIRVYFKNPLFYGSSINEDRRKEWRSHRQIMDLVLIRFLINKYKENDTIITECYNNHYLYEFIEFYTNIFNAINPNFIKQLKKIELSKIRSEQRERLKLLLDENMMEIFQTKLQDLQFYKKIMSELHPNNTTRMQKLEMLIPKYSQILEILQE
jgi:hypothetical protein